MNKKYYIGIRWPKSDTVTFAVRDPKYGIATLRGKKNLRERYPLLDLEEAKALLDQTHHYARDQYYAWKNICKRRTGDSLKEARWNAEDWRDTKIFIGRINSERTIKDLE